MYDPFNMNNFQWQKPVAPAPQQLLRVNGIESARMFPTSPNSTVALFDENEDIFYVKSTDASNFPTIKAYAFKEVDTQNHGTQYVTLEEFNKFKEELLNGKQPVSTE